MVSFQTKNPILGKFWRVLQWKILVNLITISSILLLLEIFYRHLVYFVVIWYIFCRLGILHQEKSGNPGVYFAKNICMLPNIFLKRSYMGFLVRAASVALELVVAAEGLRVAEVPQAARNRRVLERRSLLINLGPML
jgi:hypothetical protein